MTGERLEAARRLLKIEKDTDLFIDRLESVGIELSYPQDCAEVIFDLLGIPEDTSGDCDPYNDSAPPVPNPKTGEGFCRDSLRDTLVDFLKSGEAEGEAPSGRKVRIKSEDDLLQFFLLYANLYRDEGWADPLTKKGGGK